MRYVLAAFLLMGSSLAWADCQTARCRIDAIIGQYRAKGLSGVLLIRRDGKEMEWDEGLQNDKTNTPNGPGTIFLIASLSKAFVAAEILKLEEQGKLALDDKLSEWIPEYPRKNLTGRNGVEVTLENLLTHSSGVPEAYDQPEISDQIDKVRLSFADFLAVIKDKKLHFSPGTKFEYSNTGYVILGEVARRAAGSSSWAILKPEILDPLGLRHTTIGAPSDSASQAMVAHCYQGDPSARTDYAVSAGATLPLADSEVYADTDIYTTASDLARWAEGVSSGLVLSKSNTQAMFTPHVEEYGYGWDIYNDPKGRRTYEHAGSYAAFRSWIRRYPDDDTTVAWLNNFAMDDASSDAFINAVSEAALSGGW